ncbi:SHOCT domain-containing protein [uncultured Methanobrevibacter sp.]|uniref:SHOCT domain-containing protein n=1 Tax=uncultured Methanobrevibacter sp. TaxID=253161 RepID=UPI00262045A3|nr:SHOCT domain-containing protein [uncultured Methanobrevibacter sp.]
MEYVLNNPNNDIIPYFKEILEKTREIFKDIEGYVLNKIKPQIEEWFNTTGFIFNNEKQISSEEYQIIKTPITTNKHGGGTKALATLGFGLIGYAASSGVKTEVKTEKIKTSDAKYCFTTINISNKYVDIDIKITGENNTKIILKWENISLFSDDEYFVLDSGETFKCALNNQKINNLISDALIDAVITSDSKLVHEYHPKVLSKVKKFLNELINEKINSFKIKESSKSTIKLEKLIEMYDKGLLSDEEFITMKKKVK